MLPATAASLAVLAALLAWPVPALLGRAGWPRRDPLVAAALLLLLPTALLLLPALAGP